VQIFKQAHAKKKTPAAQELTDVQHYSRAAEPVMVVTQGQNAARPRGTQAQQIQTLMKNQFGKQRRCRIQAATKDPTTPAGQTRQITSQMTPS
jgi:hypothetical protein